MPVSPPPRTPTPLPKGDRSAQSIGALSWADTANRWVESHVGRWRIAFSLFMSWHEANIDKIDRVASMVTGSERLTILRLLAPVVCHYKCAINLREAIMEHMVHSDWSTDVNIDVQLEQCIRVAQSVEPFGIWQCIDRLAAFCNALNVPAGATDGEVDSGRL
ncbi:nucleoprotein [Red-crowned crane parvovirus]|uniref:Nucleoprotein n=1 Tax=Red-crowned crane parvovirus TaxID=2079601 RepID=A0A2K9YND5_9VIRU|nr:nucleoprotein [Red-crowned crane parvovirus]YP_009552826.1 nucleoprotein [Red-crowned crane parvovirus]AUW34308.1 nucleoprotein [Red-crowned crane parvovirus]AUW34312.1 nucleoprotein [Red-crowned crane parvovirus]